MAGRAISCRPATTELKVLAKCMSRAGPRPQSADEFVAQLQSPNGERSPKSTAASCTRNRARNLSTQKAICGCNRRFRLRPRTPAARSCSGWRSDSPQLLASIIRAELSPHARRNTRPVLQLGGDQFRALWGCVALTRGGQTALTIFERSDYLTDILVRYPADVALLEELYEQPGTASTGLFPAANEPERRSTGSSTGLSGAKRGRSSASPGAIPPAVSSCAFCRQRARPVSAARDLRDSCGK